MNKKADSYLYRWSRRIILVILILLIAFFIIYVLTAFKSKGDNITEASNNAYFNSENAPSKKTSSYDIGDTGDGVFEDNKINEYDISDYSSAEELISTFAADNGLSISDYPDYIIEKLRRYPEAKDFVLNYPFAAKKTDLTVDLSEYADTDSVPLFIQWDESWGYAPYNSNVIGVSGCGPVCLSMAAVFLTGDTSISPVAVAEYSQDNGYAIEDNGTSWALIYEGCEHFGLRAEELPLSEDTMINALAEGHPIICAVSEGDFTTGGHYIVLTGYRDGVFSVNDPNSYVNSRKTWTYARLKGQIRNLWEMSLAE